MDKVLLIGEKLQHSWLLWAFRLVQVAIGSDQAVLPCFIGQEPPSSHQVRLVRKAFITHTLDGGLVNLQLLSECLHGLRRMGSCTRPAHFILLIMSDIIDNVVSSGKRWPHCRWQLSVLSISLRWMTVRLSSMPQSLNWSGLHPRRRSQHDFSFPELVYVLPWLHVK